MYAYCDNNPTMYVDPAGTFLKGLLVRDCSKGKVVFNTNKAYINVLSSKYSDDLSLFGYEYRTSAGWEESDTMASGYLGRIGVSSYTTHTSGQSGALYAFAGSTSDVMNWFGTTYYAGLGVNLFDVIGVEFQLETVGLGCRINIGKFSVAVNANFIGGTSLTFGMDTDLENGVVKTDALTIGINTGLLVGAFVWAYKACTTGELTPMPMDGV